MSSPTIRDWPLPYVDRLATRDAGSVDLVVVHCTELPDLATAREYGERVLYADGSGNSGHYYIDRDGMIACFVEPHRMAHHVRGHNPRSIGIELVNAGRYPDWFDSRRQDAHETYPAAQIDALLALLAWLRDDFPALRHIAGHEALDTEMVLASDDPTRQVPRKRDPGPTFPWSAVVPACGLQRLV